MNEWNTEEAQRVTLSPVWCCDGDTRHPLAVPARATQSHGGPNVNRGLWVTEHASCELMDLPCGTGRSWGGGQLPSRVGGISVPSSQCCCASKTTLVQHGLKRIL
jgi:hypothetical protein